MDQAQKVVFTNEARLNKVARREWHGGPYTVINYRYEPGAEFPAHHHHQAQITVVLAGRLIFTAAEEKIEVGPGESVYFPPNLTHSAIVPADSEPVESINIFNPPRQEHP